MILVTVPGTWSAEDPWWQPTSLWSQAVARQGYEVVPFAWSTDLDGVVPPHREWTEASAALRALLTHQPPDVLLGHSHGGTISLMALAGLRAPIRGLRLVTVCTPVRHDLTLCYQVARTRIAHWRHLRSDRDAWQWAGALFDGAVSFERDHAASDCNQYVPGLGHAAGRWFDPALWAARGWAWLG